MTYALELKVHCKFLYAAFNAPELEMRRLNLPLGILLRRLSTSLSSGRGRFALDGGFRPVDGPGLAGGGG